MRSGSYKTETKNRVLDYLKQKQGTALSVQDIMHNIHECGHPVNITTIYRILDKLEDDDVVIRHSAENGKKALFQYIEPAAGCMHHLHVQCTSCGKIIHLDCGAVEKILEHIAQEHGMQIVCTASQLFGICKDCLKKKQTELQQQTDSNV